MLGSNDSLEVQWLLRYCFLLVAINRLRLRRVTHLRRQRRRLLLHW